MDQYSLVCEANNIIRLQSSKVNFMDVSFSFCQDYSEPRIWMRAKEYLKYLTCNES